MVWKTFLLLICFGNIYLHACLGGVIMGESFQDFSIKVILKS